MADLVTAAYATALAPGLAALSAATLANVLAAASDAVRTYCRRDFAQVARDETLDGDGSDSLTLDHFPVASIATLSVERQGTFEVVPADEYRLKKSTGQVRMQAGHFPEGWGNIRVIYTGGTPSVPTSIQQAVVQLAKAMVDQAKRDTTIDSERWADYAFTRSDGRVDFGIPETAKDLMAPYRDHRA